MAAKDLSVPQEGAKTKARQGQGMGLWLMLLVVLAAFGLRAWRLGAQSLWVDEGISVIFSSKPLDELLRTVIAEDLHPPVYYLALHYWMALAGSSEYAIRFLSAAMGLLVVPTLYQLGRYLLVAGRQRLEISPVWAGILTGTLAALSPFLVYYSQEGRNYMMVTLWTILASLALWKALETDLLPPPKRARLRWWLFYIILAALMLYTNYFGAFLLVAHVLYLALISLRHRRFPLMGAASLGVTFLLYLPWLKPGLSQLLRMQATPDFWAGSLSLQDLLVRLFVAFSLGPKAQGAAPALAALALLVAIGLASLVRIKEITLGRRELFLLLYLLVPLALVYLITARAPKFAERYLIIASPAFYLLLVRGLMFLLISGRALAGWSKAPGHALLAVFAGGTLSLLSLSGYFTYQTLNSPDLARDNNRAAVRYIEANSKPGDAIVLIMNAPQAFQYYYKGDLPWYGLQPGDDFQAAASELNRITEGKDRLWLFLWNKEWADPAGFVLDSLEEAGPRALPDRRFQGVEVRTYSLAGRPRFSADFQPRQRLSLNVEGQVELLGYDPPQTTLSSGQEGILTLYWKALQPLNEDYVVSLRLKRGGYYWGHREVRPVTYYYPTTSWRVGVPMRGQVPLVSLAGTPPGQYQIEVGLHSLSSSGPGRDLAVQGPEGTPQGTSAILGTIDLKRAAKPPLAGELGLEENTLVDLGGGLGLLGAQSAAQAVRPGDVVPLTLFWAASNQPKDARWAVLWMEDSQGKSLPLYENHPVSGAYPTDRWEAGEVVRDQYSLSVPLEASPGPATLRVALSKAGEGPGPAATVAYLNIQERIRIMDKPEGIQRPLEANLGETARLVGYNLSSDAARPGETLRLVLYWQALQETKTSYTVFTHLLDGQNKIWAQQDNLPVRGKYPTTAWVKGEYVRDEYELVVGAGAPPREYVLEVGMYEASSGRRLPVLEGGRRSPEDRVLLGKVRIGP